MCLIERVCFPQGYCQLDVRDRKATTEMADMIGQT